MHSAQLELQSDLTNKNYLRKCFELPKVLSAPITHFKRCNHFFKSLLKQVCQFDSEEQDKKLITLIADTQREVKYFIALIIDSYKLHMEVNFKNFNQWKKILFWNIKFIFHHFFFFFCQQLEELYCGAVEYSDYVFEKERKNKYKILMTTKAILAVKTLPDEKVKFLPEYFV